MARTFLAVVARLTLAAALVLSNPAGAAVASPLKQPSWLELSLQQRQILAPLASEWDRFESYRRKKWLGIAQRFPALSVEEQQRIQLRMKTWANLSPEERKRAREKYKAMLQKTPPEQRHALTQKWQEYKNLPDAEKERLKQIALRRPQPKSGAGKAPPVPPAPAVAPAAPVVPAQPAAPTPPPAASATPPQQ